jgi:hypothetical protein
MLKSMETVRSIIAPIARRACDYGTSPFLVSVFPRSARKNGNRKKSSTAVREPVERLPKAEDAGCVSPVIDTA